MAEMIIPIPAGYVSPETRRILREMEKAPFMRALREAEAEALARPLARRPTPSIPQA